MENRLIQREDLWVMSALVAVVLITAAWWALALWPAGPAAPAWLVRTQAVCFGVRSSGLPDAAGWTGLIASPLGMFGLLFVSARTPFARIARNLRRVRALQVGTAVLVVFISSGVLLATVRVRAALGANVSEILTTNYGTAIRLDHKPAPIVLTDQFGQTRSLSDFDKRTVIVTFAYAHCETVCPTLVRNATVAQAELRRRGQAPVLLIVTLDPARDTPARLPTLARDWQLGADSYVLSGSEANVQKVLDTWQIARTYDPTNGSVTHVALAYVVSHGRVIYEATSPTTDLLVHLVSSL